MSLLALPLLLVLSNPAASPDPKSLVVPPEEMARARELIRALGSPVYDEREAAHERLAKMGRLARAALANALCTNPDAEVQSRCRELLPNAASEDLKARLDTFVADSAGKFEHDLPGWNEFRKVAGASAGARELFVELLADPTNRALVLAVGGPASELGALVSSRRVEMYNGRFPRGSGMVRRDASAADVTALMFAESFTASRQGQRMVTVAVLFSALGGRTAPDGDDRSRATRAVVGKWLDTREDPTQIYQAFMPALSNGFEAEVGRLGAKLLDSDAGTGVQRATAALMVARAGGTGAAASLERALADTTPISGFVRQDGRPGMEVRDAALAALVLLSDQNPEEYGFVESGRGASQRFVYSNYMLPEPHRDAAAEKWHAWRARNPDWGKPKR